MAFKAFDIGNRGLVTLNEMANAIKDITSTRRVTPLGIRDPSPPLTRFLSVSIIRSDWLYVGQKIPTPERVKVFATGGMLLLRCACPFVASGLRVVVVLGLGTDRPMSSILSAVVLLCCQ